MTGALEGIRVLDFTRVLAGPYCTMCLGDLGADVIKVERPGTGDDLRQWGPPFTDDGESTYFLSVNRNKRSITVDLKSDAGRDYLRRLARSSDVVVENFRYGAMDAFGLGYRDLLADNPGLVYCAISGYGTQGPLKERPGYDVLLQASGGLMSITGDPDGPPMKVGVAIVDIATGLYAVIAVLAALQERNRTGRGRRLDVSLLESVLACLPNLASGYLNGGVVPQRLGNRHPNVAPYSVYPTKDGYLTLAVGNDAQWARLCRALGHEEYTEDSRFASNAGRVADRTALDELVTAWFRDHTTQTLSELLTEHGVPNGPINNVDEALASTQVEALGTVAAIDHPSAGTLRLVGSPMRYDGDPPPIRRPPPLLGEHTEEIARLVAGLDEEALAELRSRGAFG